MCAGESRNVVVVAEEAAGVHAVRLVAQSPHRLVGVLTGAPGATVSRGLSVRAIADEMSVPVLPAARVKDPAFADELRHNDVDVLLNVHSLFLIAPEVLAAPRIGSFNLHPGSLPEYAGLNIPSWAIYHGETTHAVTLHWLAPRVDAGPIAFDAAFPISEQDTGVSLSAKCVRHGLPLISELLTLLAEDPDAIPRREQNLARRRYFGKDIPHRGSIPWHGPAERVVNFVRACDYGPWPSPWRVPRSKSVRTGVDIEILRASRTGDPTSAAAGTVDTAGEDTVLVAAADEWVLVSRARIDGTSVPPVELLRPGDLLEAAS